MGAESRLYLFYGALQERTAMSNKLVQFLCYVCGIGFLTAAMMKRSTLIMTDVESFQSLLLIFCVTLLFICLGTLSRQAAFRSGRGHESSA